MCQNLSVTPARNNLLIVAIKNTTVSLQQALEELFYAEKQEERNCDKCGPQVGGSRCDRITSLPARLTIQLRRGQVKHTLHYR